jgi:hypothetical protein
MKILMYLNQNFNEYFNEFYEVINNSLWKRFHKTIKYMLDLFDLKFIILRQIIIISWVMNVDR